MAIAVAGTVGMAACGADAGDQASLTTAPLTTAPPSSVSATPPSTTAAGTTTSAAPGGPEVRTEQWDAGTIQVDERASSRLWGVVSAPASGGPYPVVVLLHGSHPICRDDPNGYGTWPCPAGTEIPNHEGLTYLAEAIAAGGAVVVAPGVNVQYTFGAGEPRDAERTAVVVEATLEALERGALGVPADQLDLDRLVLAGHSVGAQDAAILAAGGTAGFDRPVVGTVMLAPALNDPRIVPLVDLPTVVQLGECDGDTRLAGGELVSRSLGEPRSSPAALVVLEGANHNFTNAGLEGDAFPVDLPGCAGGELRADQQRALLAETVPGWVQAVLGDPGDAWATQVLLDPAEQSAGLPERVQLALLEAGEPVPVLPGGSDAALDGVALDGFTATYCPQGYYTPFVEPDREACHRPELTGFVGLPESIALSWDAAGASLTAPLDPGTRRVRLRVVPDVADRRLGDGPLVLEVSTPGGWSEQVTVAVPPSTTELADPFELVHALLLWHTAILDLPESTGEVTVTVESPSAGSLQLVSLGAA